MNRLLKQAILRKLASKAASVTKMMKINPKSGESVTKMLATPKVSPKKLDPSIWGTTRPSSIYAPGQPGHGYAPKIPFPRNSFAGAVDSPSAKQVAPMSREAMSKIKLQPYRAPPKLQVPSPSSSQMPSRQIEWLM